jgi:tetratricopeptide (TPR) repeat protein
VISTARSAHCDQAIELNPHFPHAYFMLSLVQEELGDFDEALAALLRGAQLAPRSPRMIASLGRARAIAGRRDDALKSLAELDALARTRFVSAWERGILYLGMQEFDRCFEQLELALQDRFFRSDAAGGRSEIRRRARRYSIRDIDRPRRLR